MRSSIEEYLAYIIKSKNAKPNTVSAYRTDLLQLLTFLTENRVEEPSKITETLLNSYLLLLEKQGKSYATINRSLVSIKNYMGYLMKHGQLNTDPTERIKPPKYELMAPKAVSIEQMLALLECPDKSSKRGLRDKAILELLYATGIKVTELIMLTFQDLNLRFGCVMMKGEGKERVLPLGQAAIQALKDYMIEKPHWEAEEYLFQSKQGTPFTRQGIWKMLKGYAGAAGITEELTPQMIRNSFAVHMLENGADLSSMKELMGHQDVAATLRYLKKTEGETLKTYLRTHPRAR